MDERQRQITEGAGLEESRVNKELIDFLQKWSTPVLFVILLIAGAYAGVKWLERKQIETRDAAFIAFQEAELEARPEALLEVAREYPGAAAVQELATLTAADLHLNAYYLRRMPGTQGLSAEDRIDEERAVEMLDTAANLYQDALREARSATGRELLEIGALWGLAAVDITRENWDGAEGRLAEILEIAQEEGYAELAEEARALRDRLPELRAQRAPITRLPAAPVEEEAEQAVEEAADEMTPPEGDAPAQDDPVERDSTEGDGGG